MKESNPGSGLQNGLVVERNPEIDDNAIVLDRHDSISGYINTYGDKLAEWYEDHTAIVVPHWPLPIDLAFLQSITMPPAYKKIGSANGIDGPLFKRTKDNKYVGINPLLNLNLEMMETIYLRDQIQLAFRQIRLDIARLFGRYRLVEANMTFRCVPTRDEGMHLDAFAGGGVSPMHRMKFFINIDSQNREWQTSYSLPRALEVYRDLLGDIPAGINRNDLNHALTAKLGNILPRHRISYPALSCVIANGETIFHEVTFGNRMIAGEFFTPVETMHAPDKFIGRQVAETMQRFGIGQTETAPV
ncbi:hypothetical protein FNB15_16835 [Ferrovibrio terrae]|uniref:Uncharacterized protein n=1 Tax=Ferrovibrio terrae TaxID=2594003 RepID=A0A516H4X7_9PROT|nr:hypothetical protein [Ferrovibrio terrae]QDO98834.1 hypothetical protein FNB15_16835 [Ferrovibrio terrae]